MYPAFVNCTTIDWFSEWPLDALLEVADKYLSEESLGSEEEVSYFVAYVFLLYGISISQTLPDRICRCQMDQKMPPKDGGQKQKQPLQHSLL